MKTMFKTEVVNSRNIGKTTAYKVFIVIFTIIIFTFIASSYNLFGENFALKKFLRQHSQIIPIIIFIPAVAVSIITRSRLRNPIILGQLEMDENEMRYIANDESVQTYSWSGYDNISFKFFSTRTTNNPKGCLNYLTLIKNKDKKTFEIVIENSLTKAEFGDLLREINKKVTVKIKYASLLKILFKDSDLKL